MLPASNRGAGMNIGFPDVCNTIVGPATVPIPYPNFAMNIQAAPFSPTVKVSMMPALNMGSKIPMTMGDEAGTAHPTIKGMGSYTMGNPIVFIDGMPAINLTCPTTGNNMNNPLGAVLVPSAVNVLYCWAGETVASSGVEMPAPLSGEGLTSLAAPFDGDPPARTTALDGGVAWVEIAVFSPELPSAVHAGLSALPRDRVRAIVLDLSACRGGELGALVRFASDFLADGDVVARGRDADGDPVVLRARGGAAWTVPVVCVVGPRTASAAEVLAGTLQEQGRAVIVGERTYGKGRAQTTRGLPGGGVVYGSALELTLPSGAALDARGVTPDVSAVDGDDARRRASHIAREVAR